jgi:hypothetical protein
MLKITLSLLGLAIVAACARTAPVTPAPVVVVPAQPAAPPPVVVQQQAPQVIPAPTLRAGFGRIETIAPASGTAAAGGQTMRRFGIRMDDGSLQFVDTTAAGYAVGDRIELTNDGYIRKAS